MAQAATCRSRIIANSPCRSGASGVVSAVFRSSPADAGADGADHRGRDARLLQAALGQPGGRGLALGAGHADHPQPGRRVAVHPGRQAAEHGTRPLHDQEGYAAARGVGLRARGVGEHRHRTGGHGGARELDAVGAGARQGGVQVAGQDPLGAQRDAGDLRRAEVTAGLEPRVRCRCAQPVGEVGERGPDGMPWARRRHQVVAQHDARLPPGEGSPESPRGRRVTVTTRRGAGRGAVPVGGTP